MLNYLIKNNYKNQMNYIETDNLIYKLKLNDVKKNIKIASFDLDHTLIRPQNKKTFAKSVDDFELVFPNVIEKLNELKNNNYTIIVFSNQSELNTKLDKKKLVLGRINKLYELFPDFSILLSIKNDYCRKPNIGMLDFIKTELQKNKITIDINNSFYVGDAAGRIKKGKLKKDFSTSDRYFALNSKLKFFTPEQYFLGKDERELNNNYILENLPKKLFTNNKNNKEIIKNITKYNIIILLGSPASGKSYFSTKLKDYNIISQDNLNTKTRTFNELKKVLNKNINSKIVLDNTNGKLTYRKTFTDYLNKKDLSYCLVKINVDKNQSFVLNNYRCKILKAQRLPDVVIHSYFKNYDEPTIEEGYKEIFEIDFVPDFKNKNEEELFYQYF